VRTELLPLPSSSASLGQTPRFGPASPAPTAVTQPDAIIGVKPCHPNKMLPEFESATQHGSALIPRISTRFWSPSPPRSGGEGRGEEVLTKTNAPSRRVASLPNPLPARASQGEGAGHLAFENRVEIRPPPRPPFARALTSNRRRLKSPG
jgi:hypothetical protein